MSAPCERGCGRPALVCVIDYPDAPSWSGDALAGVLLCTECLVESLVDGPWDDVIPLEDAPL